jgi:UDP-N-acetylmuramate: L-alanyl-gamma-D-glutamyl-meso-diaminopimelate ligase
MSLDSRNKKIHFISIGGSVMHNLAIELQRKGYIITGSDDEIYEPSKSRLAMHGLLPEQEGWNPDAITEDLEAVILGMHARSDNPELLKAKALNLIIYSYPEYIYQQSIDKQRVVIAGSHGKTTITSMILHVLKENGRKFNYLVGASIEGFDTMVRLDDEAPVIIVEGDEYLTSPLDPTPKFLHYQAHIALVSGIAWDHFNVFPTWESYVSQFELLLKQLPKAGVLIYDETDEFAGNFVSEEKLEITMLPYKAHPSRIQGIQSVLVTDSGTEIPLQVFGEHNLKNISGAKQVCERLGIMEEDFYKAISTFKGAAKRMNLLASNGTTHVYQDFAHAPSKVESTTKAVKNQFVDRQLVAVAELHTFSSLNKEFMPQYKGKMDMADIAIVYFNENTVKNKRLESISTSDIQTAFGRDDLKVFTDEEALKSYLLGLSWDQKNLLMMGSGTFGHLDLQKLAEQITA